jgi:hypothetical protein
MPIPAAQNRHFLNEISSKNTHSAPQVCVCVGALALGHFHDSIGFELS